MDAVAIDDELGRNSGLVVHGDHLSYRALGLLLADGATPGSGAKLLSMQLIDRAVRAARQAPVIPQDAHSLERCGVADVVPAVPGPRGSKAPPSITPISNEPVSVDLHSPSVATDPAPASPLVELVGGELVGAWQLDVQDQTLSWDLTAAQVLGRPHASQHASITQELAATHPADRTTVAGGFNDASAPVSRTTPTSGPELRRVVLSVRATGRQIVDPGSAARSDDSYVTRPGWSRRSG